MAQRVPTPEGSACSACGAPADPSAALCLSCGQPFEADAQASKCPECGEDVALEEEKCSTCGATLPEPRVVSSEVLQEIRQFREMGRQDAVRLEKVPTALPEESEAALLRELESLWKLSEPFEQVVSQRRKRLQQMDRLIASARRRVRELDASMIPAEVREREELKRQVQEVLLERDEILKIEYGITEMERIYRNIITMQQKELRSKEEALRARLEGFRRELGMRDAERAALAERETTLEQRERELQDRLEELRAREDELVTARDDAEAVLHRMPEKEGVSREEWLEAQREVQDALLKLRGREGEVGLVPTATTVRDMRLRVNELEEAFERTSEEKSRLEDELAQVRTAEEEVREILKVLDELLEKLPDEEVRKFARSEAFARYEKLMERLGL